jgi:hypothetical protein
MDLRAQLLDPVLVAGDEVLPSVGVEFRHAVEPKRVELGAQIFHEEILTHDAVALGKPHQASLVTDETPVDVIELLDQRVDARSVQP